LFLQPKAPPATDGAFGFSRRLPFAGWQNGVLMCVRYWLLAAARPLWRGRSLCWPLRAAPDGSLRSRFLRLRLYGVGDVNDDGDVTALLAGKSCRWRVVGLARDGCLFIVVRVDGRSLALSLLRGGSVEIRGCASRRWRGAREAARREKLGRWRCAAEEPTAASSFDRPPPFPWWQG
jgi:hypothetical protein